MSGMLESLWIALSPHPDRHSAWQAMLNIAKAVRIRIELVTPLPPVTDLELFHLVVSIHLRFVLPRRVLIHALPCQVIFCARSDRRAVHSQPRPILRDEVGDPVLAR